MYLLHLFRSFLPLHNPIGFGASDFIGAGLALLLVLLVLGRAWLEPAAQRLAAKPVWSMAFLFVLAVVLRLALLPLHPVPTPSGADDFGYLLLGDTLAHFRLANPPHPMHRFFETTFVLQEPSYSAFYPIAQGILLAFGQVVFGIPWAGVLLSTALISGLCYWMLRGWTSPGWALTGGLLAVCQFGPLNRWMNNYWGGALPALAGCLVFGALPRLRERARTRDAVLLGFGAGLCMLSRPFESLFLDLSVILFFVPELRRRAQWPRLARIALPAALALLPAAALQLLHDRAATGSWTTIPYALGRYQYGVPAAFTFQPNPVPHAELTPAQRLYYEGQAAVHGGVDTPATYLARLASRAGFYRFFFLAPLCLALPFFLPLLREYRYAWIVLAIVVHALGTNFYPYFFPQYIGALTSIFVLVSVLGLARLSAIRFGNWPGGQTAARWLAILCGAHFLFWYTVHLVGDERMLLATTPYEMADVVNFGDPEGRIAVNRRLAEAPGRHLVFVRYFVTHAYHEWIHNLADIDQQRVVWALERTPEENAKLMSYYPGRKVWLMEPDAIPPRLNPYPAGGGPFVIER